MSDLATHVKIIACIFAASFIICIPFWFEYHTEIIYDQNLPRVYIGRTPVSLGIHNKFFVHVILTTILAYTIPLILLTVMNYYLIIVLIKTRRRKFDLGLKERNELYLKFMLVSIVLFFIICQMPNLVMHIIHALNYLQTKTHSYI